MTALAQEQRPTQTQAEVTRDVVATLGTQSRGYTIMLLGAVGARTLVRHQRQDGAENNC